MSATPRPTTAQKTAHAGTGIAGALRTHPASLHGLGSGSFFVLPWASVEPGGQKYPTAHSWSVPLFAVRPFSVVEPATQKCPASQGPSHWSFSYLEAPSAVPKRPAAHFEVVADGDPAGQ